MGSGTEGKWETVTFDASETSQWQVIDVFRSWKTILVVFKELSTKSFPQNGTYSSDLHSLVNGITDPCTRRLWINNLVMLSVLQKVSVVS